MEYYNGVIMLIEGKRELEGANIQILTAKNGRFKENSYVIEAIKEMADGCRQVAVKMKGNELTIVGSECGEQNRENKVLGI